MSQAHYDIPGRYTILHYARPQERGQPRTLSNHHRHMLEVESGISPGKIAERGYWTAHNASEIPAGFYPSQYQPNMFPILVIPQWNTVGRQSGYVLRPDHPRLNDDGNPIKYESMPGGPVGFDCPPSMVHLLRNPSVPLYITEGSKKADAMASRGLPCISLNGVYGFMTKRVIVSELDEIATDGRIVRPIFDSDVMTKASVADALDRFNGATTRRGGIVEAVYLPAGDDGAKVGIDDYFASGGQPADLDRLTRPWKAVSDGPSYEELQAENVILRRRDAFLREGKMQAEQRALDAEARDRAKHDLLLNTHYAAVPRALLYNTIVEAEKVAGKRIDEPTQVIVPLARSCNDYRRKGQSGYNDNGTKPITDRKNAKKLFETFIGNGILNARIQDRIRDDANGKPYESYDLIIELDDTTDTLRRIAKWEPEQKKKTRGPNIVPQPCKGCGKVECRVQRTTCQGCGFEDAPPKVLPPRMGPATDNATGEPEEEGEKFSPNTSKGLGEKFSPAPSDRSGSENLSRPTQVQAGEKFSPLSSPPRSPAAQWLFDYLRGGMRPVADVGQAAAFMGFSRAAIREAREELGAKSFQPPRESRLYLRLPSGRREQQPISEPAEPAWIWESPPEDPGPSPGWQAEAS